MYKVPSPLRVFARNVWSNKDNKDNDDIRNTNKNKLNNT